MVLMVFWSNKSDSLIVWFPGFPSIIFWDYDGLSGFMPPTYFGWAPWAPWEKTLRFPRLARHLCFRDSEVGHGAKMWCHLITLVETHSYRIPVYLGERSWDHELCSAFFGRLFWWLSMWHFNLLRQGPSLNVSWRAIWKLVTYHEVTQ